MSVVGEQQDNKFHQPEYITTNKTTRYEKNKQPKHLTTTKSKITFNIYNKNIQHTPQQQ